MDLKEALSQHAYGRISDGTLRDAIMAHPAHVSGDDPLFNSSDLRATSQLVMDRIEQDKPVLSEADMDRIEAAEAVIETMLAKVPLLPLNKAGDVNGNAEHGLVRSTRSAIAKAFGYKHWNTYPSQELPATEQDKIRRESWTVHSYADRVQRAIFNRRKTLRPGVWA
jgi:hypothetical protein